MPLGRHTGQETGRKKVDGRYRKKRGDQTSLRLTHVNLQPPPPKEKTQTTMSASPNDINPSERKKERKRELDDSEILTMCFRL